MAFEDFTKKQSVVLVYTGDGKGKTSAGLGLMVRALGAGFTVGFVQFIKAWDVSEHGFIKNIQPLYGEKLVFYKGGLGFYNAGDLSAKATDLQHRKNAKDTYNFAYEMATSNKYDVIICDEINNAVNDGLLDVGYLKKLINDKSDRTSLCLTGRNFPKELLDIVDIATEMKKIKHHFDDKLLANLGIDY